MLCPINGTILKPVYTTGLVGRKGFRMWREILVYFSRRLCYNNCSLWPPRGKAVTHSHAEHSGQEELRRVLFVSEGLEP